jgi:hypothetical protein
VLRISGLGIALALVLSPSLQYYSTLGAKVPHEARTDTSSDVWAHPQPAPRLQEDRLLGRDGAMLSSSF